MTKAPKKGKRAESRPASSPMAAAMGRAIQVVRTDRGWSRKEFAARTGLSYSFLSEIENGVKEFSSRTLAVMADALDVAPGALLYDAQRRLVEADSASGDATRANPGRKPRTAPAGAEPALSARHTRSVEELEQEASYFASERSSPHPSHASAPRGESGPRIERSRRVFDWLSGPLARRSSEDSTPTAASRERLGVTVDDDQAGDDERALLMAVEAQPTEPGAAEQSDESLLDALLPLLGELSPEDRERVLDLARRLAQRNSEP